MNHRPGTFSAMSSCHRPPLRHASDAGSRCCIMPVETGGMMQQREPASDAWRKGGLWHDDMALNVPGLWFMSWYDVSVGPNLEMFNHVRRTAKAPIKDQQWAVIAPVAH